MATLPLLQNSQSQDIAAEETFTDAFSASTLGAIIQSQSDAGVAFNTTTIGAYVSTPWTLTVGAGNNPVLIDTCLPSLVSSVTNTLYVAIWNNTLGTFVAVAAVNISTANQYTACPRLAYIIPAGTPAYQYIVQIYASNAGTSGFGSGVPSLKMWAR